MNRLRVVAVCFFFCFFFGTTVGAHDAAMLDSIASIHGGQVRMAGPYHLELLVESGIPKNKRPIVVYLQNHDFHPMPSRGITGTVELSEGAHSVVARLRPERDDSLLARARYPGVPTLVVHVSITTRDGQTYTAAFMPLAPKTAASAANPNVDRGAW